MQHFAPGCYQNEYGISDKKTSDFVRINVYLPLDIVRIYVKSNR